MRFSQFARWTTLCGMALASLSGAWAQPSKLIEVASVKPSGNTSADSNLDSVRGRLTATNISVGYLIRFAYGVKDYQMERAPGWVDSALYDIAAKSANSKTGSLEDLKAMVRELLADRFQLTPHRETKPMRIYVLVVAKSGPKLTLHNDGTGAGTRKGCGHLAGSRLTMDVFATVLSRELETDVINQTGLPGKYDFQLDWAPDSHPCRVAADSQGGSAATDPSGLPSLYTALQQQLGLKMESAKGPVEFLVIDRVERPSEN
ncbi:MAG: TIGR03435 family protein [Bryobacteraceae bacterium]